MQFNVNVGELFQTAGLWQTVKNKNSPFFFTSYSYIFMHKIIKMPLSEDSYLPKSLYNTQVLHLSYIVSYSKTTNQNMNNINF